MRELEWVVSCSLFLLYLVPTSKRLTSATLYNLSWGGWGGKDKNNSSLILATLQQVMVVVMVVVVMVGRVVVVCISSNNNPFTFVR
jgi:hypothetical protein